ncbi:MAG: hypothetical protein RLZZ387_2799 [Chloroflexota bacterium]|jgi:GNAT superfamily N-acetyltransferase
MTEITLLPGRPGAALIARFVAESLLDYPLVDGIDARLQAWSTGEGCWVVAFTPDGAAGIACLVTLDDGPFAGDHCLFWLEVLPDAQGSGVGRALLAWATQQAPRLVIAPTPGSASFYTGLLPHAEPHGSMFVVEPPEDVRRAAQAIYKGERYGLQRGQRDHAHGADRGRAGDALHG